MMARAKKTATRSSGKGSTADAQLSKYRSMRDFAVTGEPSGAKVRAGEHSNGLPFVIQKHAATRLHYDFRLGWNGVLKSWAVTKGPSYFPGDKRLAVEVEDHPIEYGGFEGVIPKGQYGGGTVMLWDRGTWEPHVDVDEGLKKGSLKFTMHGEKMVGNWALVRMHPRPGDRSDKPNWLLIKEHDAKERGEREEPITEAAPDSVLTGRDLDAIAQDRDRVWNSNHEELNRAESEHARAGPAAKKGTATSSQAASKVDKVKAREWGKELKGAPREMLPEFVSPQMATLAKSPPTGERWVHEIKLDGYRIQIRIDNKKGVQLLTRNGLDWTHRMKGIADAALRLPVKSALIDGEVVVLAADGTSSFAQLQAAFQEGAKTSLTFYAFDLLHLDGHSLRDLPLWERKDTLQRVLAGAGEEIRFSEHLAGDAAQIFRKACKLGAEGIISKLAEGKYIPARSGGWLKTKCYQEQELVIGGFTLPTNGIRGVGALLLGYYKNGTLIYAGRTGTGFTQKTHAMMRDRLEEIRSEKPPFSKLPTDARKGAIWVKPQMVAQVSFSNWTADGLVRQASFKGLREDKVAKSVVREEPKSSATVAASAISSKNAGNGSGTKKKTTAMADTNPLPIRLTHPDKVLDAETGVTKEQLARFYLEVSESMLPHIAGRPVTLVRCVDGSGKPCFYQKHKNQILGKGFESIEVVNRTTGEREPYITLSSPDAIVQLAQIGVLEVHPWGSRNETMEQPDRIIIDLDPDGAIDWKTLTTGAKEVRRRLNALGLTSFVKTAGGKGLHVVVPIRSEHEWPAVKQFTHDFVLGIEKDDPRLFLTKMSKAARAGKIFLDYLRNDRGATAVAPFSPRARAGLPVAIPLSWSELDADRMPRFQVSDIGAWRKRLARDPWKEMAKTDQRLPL